MARCGCASTCACVVTASGCAVVTGNGNPGTPYDIDVLVDPDVTNQLSCQVDGLFVPPPTVVVDDTNCVNMDGTGAAADPITATLTLDPDACNILACSATGLTAEISVQDSECAALSGCGTVADPLIAEARISADVGNVISCRADGLYVATGGASSVDIYGSLGRSAAYASGAGVGAVNIAPFPFDVVQQDFGTITDVANSQFVIPVGGDGWYHITAKLVEGGVPGDSFEGTGAFYQCEFGITAPGVHLLAKHTYDLLCDLTHSYFIENVVYLTAGDTVYAFLNIIESTGLLAVAARTFDVIAYGDGTFPCNIEIERIGV